VTDAQGRTGELLDDRAVQLGIVGLGNWSRQVFYAAGQVPEAAITGCYSRHPSTRQAFASEFGCRPYESYEQMADDPQIEGIIVMSANSAHEQDVSIAASHGKHVLVTKPIAATIAAGKRMIETCRENRVTLAVGHQTRREPALRKLRGVLDSGALGDLRLVEANYSTPNGIKIRSGDWRWSEQECPGGPLIQIGIHVIDTLLCLLGPIRRVYSWQERGGIEAEIAGVTATLLEFESGLRGYLGSSYVTRFAHWITIYGTRKNALFSELGGLRLTDDSWEDGEVWDQLAPPAELGAPMPTIVEELREFARCIRTGEEPEIGGEAGLHNLAVVLAAVESNRTGQPVEVASVLESSEA